MKSLSSLKSKELRASATIAKLVNFVKWVDAKVQSYTKYAIAKLRDELAAQKVIREERLAVLALEASRIKNEIEEITTAHTKHTDTLSKL